MELTYYGHSFFTLKSDEGITIAMDPFDDSVGYPLPQVKAQLVLTSHDHFDHNNSSLIEDKRLVICGPGEFSYGPVRVMGIPAYHDAEQGKLRGKNTIYRIEVDGVAFCHCGDLGHLLDHQTRETLGKIDVLLVPVGGISTIDAHEAAILCHQIKPKLVIPMHYKTPCLTFELGELEPFLEEMHAPAKNQKHTFFISKYALPDNLRIVIPSFMEP
ncbi:MAG: MBL fold metallo-hydrolase [Acidaminococcus sp.]|jgi:L-ascorbate metabolism protein UlaG (beta-lactamase superfamily)|nr:MBL fold metallo-hydrolase [Acidaminococcus sp.]MCI2100647.1 MBL fold metallo-hydrolase [Acidaminococcus sp.]MCI2114967.1 MBL fold metallo-hydrolase [Acidaminococcus sp.]MCI2117013.1 MBL fold metallo-hydrolase [Acidaminococcus sp.]